MHPLAQSDRTSALSGSATAWPVSASSGLWETPASDIEILGEFREGEETFDHFMDLKFYLEDLLGRKTDLVIADTLKPRIRDAVLGEVVYA
jgi:hypothetical protein